MVLYQPTGRQSDTDTFKVAILFFCFVFVVFSGFLIFRRFFFFKDSPYDPNCPDSYYGTNPGERTKLYFLVQILIFFFCFFFIVSCSYTPFSPNLYVPGLWENKGKLFRGVLPNQSARH